MAEIAKDLAGVAERVTRARKQKHWTIDQLAEAIGKSQSSVSRIEQGVVLHIEVGTAWRIADALGVSRNWLLSGEGEP